MLAGSEESEVVVGFASVASRSVAVAVVVVVVVAVVEVAAAAADLGRFAATTSATELGVPRYPLNLPATVVADDFVLGKCAIE